MSKTVPAIIINLLLLATPALAAVRDTLKSPADWFFTHSTEIQPVSKGAINLFQIFTPDGVKPYKIFSSSPSARPVRVGLYIKGKFYSEGEALKLSRSIVNEPGLKYGFQHASIYAVPGVDLSQTLYLFWMGEPPPLTKKETELRELKSIYENKKITTVVLAPSFKPGGLVPDGFTIEYNKKLLKVYMLVPGADRLMKRIGPGDILIIEINMVYLDEMQVLVAHLRTLIKDGETLIKGGNVQI